MKNTSFVLLILIFGAIAKPSFADTKNPEKVVVFVGDSLADGYGVKKGQAFPEIVGEQLRSRGRQIRVVNGAISGSVSADADRRVKWFLKLQPKPDVLVLELGSNDALKGTPIAVIRKNLEEALLIADQAKLKTLLLGMKMFTNFGPAYTKEFTDMYAQLASKHHAALVPFLLEDVALKPNLMQADQKHPNSEGHKIVAKRVADALEKLFVILRARDVRKTFGSLEILRGVSLEVETPQTISIMGRSGCGKSTFISLLAGLDTASGGTIEILNQNLDGLDGGALNQFRARHIGIIFQQFHLLDHLNAIENVRLPLDLNRVEGGDRLAHDMLERVGLSHRAQAFPETLSRGEQQRVAIARVLVMKPEVLLADEPTGSLDVKTGASVIELLFDLVKSEKMTLVMATHDPALAAKCDELFVMDEGLLRSGSLK